MPVRFKLLTMAGLLEFPEKNFVPFSEISVFISA